MDTKPPKPKSNYLHEEFSKLADIVMECTENLRTTCKNINGDSGNLHISIKSVYDAETRADYVRDELLLSFVTERHPPLLQIDRVNLMRKLDIITNKAEHAARQIELANEFFPVNELPALIEIADIVVDCVNQVCKAVKLIFDSFPEASEAVENIESLRDKTRDLSFALLARILKDPSTTFQRMYAAENIVQRVQQVAERAEEAADLIDNMKMKYL